MKLKAVLFGATALGLLMATSIAHADSNTLYIKQNGDNNQADVHQSGSTHYGQPSSGNDIGLSGAPVLQNGDDNYLGYSNDQYGSGQDNDIVALSQHHDNNWVNVIDSNGAAHTRINNVSQDGDDNQLAVTRSGEQYSLIDQVLMSGSNNNVWIRQGPIYRSGPGTYGPNGGWNTISLVKIDGNNNGIAYINSPGDVYSAGIWIEQTGSALSGGIYNTIAEASITGDNNPGVFGHAISIYQEGSYNGRTNSIARIKGSESSISVSEIGDWNNFKVLQGVNTNSSNNQASVAQLGNSNDAEATQFGDDNRLAINQIGNGNSAIANFSGDRNGNGTLTGIAGNLLLANAHLTEGTIYQDSSSSSLSDSVTYNVTGDDNLFAMAQVGGANNTITGTVTSDGNQVAVLQNGSGNTTSFTQSGAGNNAISVSQ